MADYPTRAVTNAEREEGKTGPQPCESRREAVEVALSQVMGSAYGSDVGKLRTHSEVVLRYVDQWDAAFRADTQESGESA